MVLPIPLMVRYNHILSFYACTVSNFDQYTLTRFIQEGYLEKHINRMRKFYRNSRDRILGCIRSHRLYPQVTIKEENAGLHFLMEIDTSYTDREMVDRLPRQESTYPASASTATEKSRRTATRWLSIIRV